MDEPFTAKEIETRAQCSKILQILEGVMEDGGQVNEGKYLEMCNILKELYKQWITGSVPWIKFDFFM